jgi:RNA 2',3'-cyclic 3'-phosphodiesterase
VTGESARLFVALELPAVARTALSRWSHEWLRDVAGLRLLEPESFHVTLCFLGHRGVDEVGAIAAACQGLERHRQLALALGAGLWLPARRPRVVAIELSDGDGALARLQSDLAGVLQAGGWYEPEHRRFLGHVTVARVARGNQREPVGLSQPVPLRFVSAAVTLYRSRLGPGGARYQPLQTVDLAGR